MVTYRILPPEEWNRLEPLHLESFPTKSLLPPETHIAAVAEEDGVIRAALFLGPVFHMEPLMAYPGYGAHITSLAKTIEAAISGITYYTFVPTRLQKAAEAFGLLPLGDFIPMFKEL